MPSPPTGSLISPQALMASAPPGVPARRTTQGIDGNRLALLLAVLQQPAGIPTHVHDVYASAVGKISIERVSVTIAASKRRASISLAPSCQS